MSARSEAQPVGSAARTEKPEQPQPHAKAMAVDPFEDSVLDQFYRPQPAQRAPSGARTPVEPKAKPTHYRIVCISLYNEDIERLESMVAELKRRGHTKANKSQLIRASLDQVDLDKIPKSH